MRYYSYNQSTYDYDMAMTSAGYDSELESGDVKYEPPIIGILFFCDVKYEPPITGILFF